MIELRNGYQFDCIGNIRNQNDFIVIHCGSWIVDFTCFVPYKKCKRIL